jgi:hypothetical protein
MGLMSWSDDIRCLYCDGRLPLYRKITHGQFCSSAHRKEYWKEQERLAVERLNQTHNSLRAWRPAPLEPTVEPLVRAGDMIAAVMPEPAAAGPAIQVGEQTVPVLTGAIPTVLEPAVDVAPELIAADPLEYEIETSLRCPEVEIVHEPRTLAMVDLVALDLRQSWEACAAPGVHRSAALRSDPLEPLAARPAIIRPRAIPLWEDVLVRVLPEPVRIAGLDEDKIPSSDRLSSLSRISICGEAAGRYSRVASLHPLPPAPRPCLIGAQAAPAPLLAPTPGGLLSLDLRHLQPALGPRQAHVEFVEFRSAKRNPEFHPAIEGTASGAGLSLAPGCRYAVAPAAPNLRAVTGDRLVPVNPRLLVTLPEHPWELLPPPMPDPPLADTVRLEFETESAPPAHARPAGILSTPQPSRVPCVLPKCRLEPLRGRPVADPLDVPGPEVSAPQPVAPPRDFAAAQRERNILTIAAGFWQNAPRDLKILLVAVPVLIGLALHAPLPKGSIGGSQTGLREVWNNSITNFRQTMSERAAVALDEDFRSGLDGWGSRTGEPVEWSYDATGFVRPGDLALYTPSTGLADYQLQFLGMIDQKAMSWVVRAADFDNYYVVKMAVTKPGPVPEIGITRYAVINGKAQDRADTAVPISARADTLYRVRMDIHGDDFALAVQDQSVDSWSEPRLRHGGVGFFNSRGEESRVRWVQVTHQYDMLGRLCAYLAPYNISSTNGSFQQ